MKRAVIFLHGNKPSVKSVRNHLRKTDTIICADGGTIYAVSFGLKPDIYIGDLDSISPSLHKKLQKEKIEWHTYPKEKDETDSELALEYAIKNGFTEIILFAVFGNRVDHVLANLTMFAKLQSKKVHIKIIEGNQELFFVKSKLVLQGKIGEYVSLIPMQTEVTVSTKNLKWELADSVLEYGKTRGISNEFAKRTAEISVKKGTLLVIHTRS
jgi:thiamine pyrophosphokinase